MSIHLPANIRTLRLAHGMRQCDLAEKLNLSTGAIQHYERRGAVPHQSVIRLGEVFGINLHDLCFGEVGAETVEEIEAQRSWSDTVQY